MSWINSLRFDANGLVPAVIQDADTGQVLMVGYMNRESLQRTLETGVCTYWSRSRQTYWVKGETSGHKQHVKRILVDCDADAVLIQVEQVGVACHTGHRSCFYRAVEDGSLTDVEPVLIDLQQVYG
jgi:phosphoribosyl-AMP cyclohydrolase